MNVWPMTIAGEKNLNFEPISILSRLGRINQINLLLSHKEKYIENLKGDITLCRIQDQ